MQTNPFTISTPQKITFRAVFDADNGRGREFRASALGKTVGGYELSFEFSSGAWRWLGSHREAPEWVSAAWQQAKPALVGWRPSGHLGREGYWVGRDDQRSNEVTVTVQAAERALLISAINALPRGAALCDHSAYIFHPDDDLEQPAQLLVDILAWRTHSQKDEDARWHDKQALLHAIESLPAVRDIEQVGDIDHENGRGWTYEVTLA